MFVQVVSPPIGWSPLSYFVVVWSQGGDTRGSSVVIEAVDLPCPGPLSFSDHVRVSCSLSDPVVGPSVLLCHVEHTSFHFGMRLCSVQVSAPHVIAGSKHDLCTCLFRQMARLILKICRCSAFFSVRLWRGHSYYRYPSTFYPHFVGVDSCVKLLHHIF